MHEGATSEANKRVFFCPETINTGTYYGNFTPSKTDELPKEARDKLFFLEKRNEEIKRAWKKDQYYKAKGQFSFRK